MANDIKIQSLNQYLGNMIRKVIAETALNDVNVGSALLTLLEAAASNDYDNSVAILNVLELLNIDAVKNNDLDARAADYGLSRRAAIRSSGLVDILNTNITKRSASLYVVKPAPIAGQTVLYVNSTTGWNSSGSLYIGRGTDSFEGPINYSSITEYPTYSVIQLDSALQKDHLISDTVIDSQGQADRVIIAGTNVKIPANNLNPEIVYSTLRDAILPAGEDHVSGVEVIAQNPGTLSNAPINTITQYATPPFPGAGVTNTSSFSNGRDIETDTELRNRIKSYSLTLARGTSPSILAGVIGISDPDDAKQVASAVLTEPVKIGDPSILYIDDGSGFEPSFAGQSVDTLLNQATGQEEFLQLANYPLPRPQVINQATGPFTITNNSFLRVEVDGKEETVFFLDSDFLNSTAATISEIAIAANRQSTLFKVRFTNNSTNLLIYPTAHDAEIIRVTPIRAGEAPELYANTLLKFPTTEFSYISLYKNSIRLREKERSAELETVQFAAWNINAPGNIIIAVDNTPAQNRQFELSDFPGATSFAGLVLEDWVEAFNQKFAGITAEVTPSQNMVIRSNRIGEASSLEVIGGDFLDKLFPNLPLSSIGQTAQFQLNRQTGNIRILSDIEAGDSISAGVEDAKGFAISAVTPSGSYNVAADGNGKPAEMIVVADSSFCNQRSTPLLVGASISITQTGNVMRIMSSTLDAFANLLPGDYIYIAPRTAGWLDTANTGLFKIFSKGNHLTSNTDSYVDVHNISGVTEGPITIVDATDIKAFSTDGYPQIWRGIYAGNPPAEPIGGIVSSMNRRLLGVKASIYKSSSIKLTSATEAGGSIALPVVSGTLSQIFDETISAQTGNAPHIANRLSSKELITFFKRTEPTSTNVWLDRHIYSDLKGSLTDDSTPDAPPFTGTYSEIVEATGQLTPANVDYDDYVAFSRGNNKGQIRSVKAKIAGDQVGTQTGTAYTELDHTINDEYTLLRSLQISSEDSVVAILDKDSTNKTIDIQMARTGIINSGSNSLAFLPTTTEFSATDYDNEPGIDFSDPVVWGTSANNTDFSDYAVWFQSRNWYASGGVGGSAGKMIVRNAQFGPNGDRMRFNMIYPSSPNQAPTTQFINTPSYTTFSYVFGSNGPRAISVSSGDTVTVNGPYPDTTTNFPNGTISSGNYYDYTFSGGNFTSVTVGDVLAINDSSGISTFNRGRFRVANKSGLTVRVFNPNASVTSPGSAETTSVTTIDQIVGTPTYFEIDTVADVAGSLHQTYFIVQDTLGSVAIWFDVDNTGVAPPPHGANRAIKVANIASNDSAIDVANKIATVVTLDNAFTTSVISNQVTITNTQNGILSAATAGTSGFTVSTTTGTDDLTIDGTYFLIYDDVGSVAVWFDIGDDNTIEPFHGADRSIRVSGLGYGDDDDTIAAAIVAALTPDIKFGASAVGPIVTITRLFDGNVPNASAGTSGFSVSDTDGSLPTPELITNQNAISVFPLLGKDLTTITNTVNASQVVTAVAVSGTEIDRATHEEDYTYGGNSTALGYGHNPTNASLRDHIKLYDGENWVKAFTNANPNFTLKTDVILQNVAPSVYSMDTAPNPDSLDIGEKFKLIPTTVKNIYHHFTQKALSQLPIVANVSIAADRKNVQITSKQLGSDGAIELVGGNANRARSYILSESEVATDTTGNHLLVKVPAFPDTFNADDLVLLQNDAGVKRLSRLEAGDSIDTTVLAGNIIQYAYNPKTTNITDTTEFTITDVSASYGRPAGIVWRWTHDGSATLTTTNAGDLLYAFNVGAGWAQANKSNFSTDEVISGFPIINVNDASNYVDVVNPFGLAMISTAVGVGGTVQICPTPIIKWNLKHAARLKVNQIDISSGVATVQVNSAHKLNGGDSIDLLDSTLFVDGTYGPITVTSATTFTFATAELDNSETPIGCTIIKSSQVETRYRLEKLGLNNLLRLSRQDGESPRFTDCGVAVDDYILIGGSTFKANNNGRFRVLAVDNDSLIIANPEGTEELNTIRNFNNKGLLATWGANTSTVSGLAGTFKNLSIGDWVKKPEDPESYYVQIVSFNAAPDVATTMSLGGNYKGITAIASGVAYDQAVDYDKGVVLLNPNDIQIYEGDSAVAGDTLFIQNIVNANWFAINNIGSFEVAEVGINTTTYKPFLNISNAAGSNQTNRLISVNPEGFYLVEGFVNRYSSIRKIKYAVFDDLNIQRRSIYMTPHNRSYKFSSANKTTINHLGKMGYSTDVTTGVDGYLYYTGLLRRVQRTVDGYEPDPENFPGRRAVGGLIETLPPLRKRITMSVDVTTDEGVNLGDISNNIKSVIINYVNDLGVGSDVILSEIIASIMQIKGVNAITFTTPVPSTERITVASNEKATIRSEDIGVS